MTTSDAKETNVKMCWRLLIICSAAVALSACAGGAGGQFRAPIQSAPSKTEGALALFPLLDAEAGPKENIFYSPASVSQAFGLLQLGADGETLAQLQGLLPPPADAATLESHERNVEVSLANALWLSNDFRFRDSYVAAVRARYDARAEAIDVMRPEATANRINTWAKEETKGLIESILALSEINPGQVAFLTNALYFEGKWAKSFDEGSKRRFLFGDGREEPFQLMETTQERASIDRDGWRALRLPYNNSRYVMDVIMPAERKVIAGAPSLDYIGALGEALGKAEPRRTQVRLPRFEISWESGLIPALRALGLTLPFDQDRADLSAMAEPGQRRIFVSSVKQKSKLQVFEQGTRAAAVTVATISVTSARSPSPDLVDFTVDRPFVLVLRDLEQDEVLFIGRISAPQVYEVPAHEE